MKHAHRRFAAPPMLSALLTTVATVASAGENDFYAGAPRTYMYNPDADICFRDTSIYKKDPPYTIGFSNAGLGDSWRVVGLHSLMKAAAENSDVIEHLYITDAGHDDSGIHDQE